MLTLQAKEAIHHAKAHFERALASDKSDQVTYADVC
jgi:hypothetical protein